MGTLFRKGRKLKRSMEEHLLKEQEFLVRQLELLNKESESASGSPIELCEITYAMKEILKMMSIPYALRFGIILAVLFELLIRFIIFVKKLLTV